MVRCKWAVLFALLLPNGETGHLRSTLVRDGGDAYWFNAFMQKNGEWTQALRIRYEQGLSANQ